MLGKSNQSYEVVLTITAYLRIHFYFVISYSTLNFSKNIPILLCSFPNSNSIFYPSMEYLTTKILYPHPNWKHVASLHSKRWLAVLASLHEITK